jgi:hypothetical protein
MRLNNMIKSIISGFICGLVIVFLTGCSAHKKLGRIVPDSVVCVTQEDCKTSLAKACDNGGAIHRVLPALVIEYTCND